MLEYSKITALLQFGLRTTGPLCSFGHILARLLRKAKRTVVARFLLLIFYF